MKVGKSKSLKESLNDQKIILSNLVIRQAELGRNHVVQDNCTTLIVIRINSEKVFSEPEEGKSSSLHTFISNLRQN